MKAVETVLESGPEETAQEQALYEIAQHESSWAMVGISGGVAAAGATVLPILSVAVAPAAVVPSPANHSIWTF